MSAPAVDLAVALIDEAVEAGVREVVVCPGSRSAPLAYAAYAAAAAGRVRLHVRIDERSAGFLALGLAKLSRRPAIVVTTSGTAVANLHPAVLEAHHACVPLLVVSADRPLELRYSGANQTTVQPGIFCGATRFEADVMAPSSPSDVPAVRPVVRDAYAAATGDTGDPGPAHLNLCLREPLVPGEWPVAWPAASLRLTPGIRRDHSEYQASTAKMREGIPHEPRTLVVLGDLVDPADRPDVCRWAAARGYPVVAEPFGVRTPGDALPHGPLILSDLTAELTPDRVVTVGRVTLSRLVAQLLRRKGIRVDAVTDRELVTDPAGVVGQSYPLAALKHEDSTSSSDFPAARSDWHASWLTAGNALADAIAADPPPWGTGLGAARVIGTALSPGSTLFVGSSNPVRDIDLGVAGVAGGVTVVASRGLAGIDGCISTAAGIALTHGAAYALVGDLTFLHDTNGLLLGPEEPRPDLTIVVVNDGGGGIFGLLEPGQAHLTEPFERLFGTPPDVDLAALCVAHGVPHQRADAPEELEPALGEKPCGMRIVEVLVDRTTHRAEHERLRAIAARVLTDRL